MSTIDYTQLSKQRLGQALEAARAIAGIDIDEAAGMLGVSRRKLQRWENGKTAPDADMAATLISVYGLDLGGQLSQRTPIVFDPDAGGVKISNRVVRYIPGVTDNDDFLEGYVAVVRELRKLEPDEPIQLRSTDIAVLASVLDLRDDDLESKLAYWMGQPPGSMIGVRHRLVMAAVLLGVVGAATIGGIVGNGASAAASPSDTGGDGAAITHTLDGPGPGMLPTTDLGNAGVQHTTATTSFDSSADSGGHHVVMDFSPLMGLDLGVDGGGHTLSLDDSGSPADAGQFGGVDAGGVGTATSPTHATASHAPSADSGSAPTASAPSPTADAPATATHAPAPAADAPAAPDSAPAPAPAPSAPTAPAHAADPAPAPTAPAPAEPTSAHAADPAPAPTAPAPAEPAPAPAAPAPAPAPTAPAPAEPAPAPAAPAPAPAPAPDAPAADIGNAVAPGDAAAATGSADATSVTDTASSSATPEPSAPAVSSNFEGTREWARQNLNGEWANGWRGDGVALTGNQLWQAASGDTSVDMNANGPGTLSRTIDTEAGVHYQITFEMSGNPHGQRGVKTLDVHADGDTATFSTDTVNISRNNMQWQTMTMDFVATGSSTDLSFQSTTPGAVGAVIDSITITPIG